MKASDEARKQRERKKSGKKVQTETLQKRIQERKTAEQSIAKKRIKTSQPNKTRKERKTGAMVHKAENIKAKMEKNGGVRRRGPNGAPAGGISKRKSGPAMKSRKPFKKTSK